MPSIPALLPLHHLRDFNKLIAALLHDIDKLRQNLIGALVVALGVKVHENDAAIDTTWPALSKIC